MYKCCSKNKSKSESSQGSLKASESWRTNVRPPNPLKLFRLRVLTGLLRYVALGPDLLLKEQRNPSHHSETHELYNASPKGSPWRKRNSILSVRLGCRPARKAVEFGCDDERRIATCDVNDLPLMALAGC